MTAPGSTGAGRNARILLVLSLAVCTLLFVAISASHIHTGGQEDAACRLCQAAQIGVFAAPPAVAQPVPRIERAELPVLVALAPLELFRHNAPSRAPPVA